MLLRRQALAWGEALWQESVGGGLDSAPIYIVPDRDLDEAVAAKVEAQESLQREREHREAIEAAHVEEVKDSVRAVEQKAAAREKDLLDLLEEERNKNAALEGALALQQTRRADQALVVKRTLGLLEGMRGELKVCTRHISLMCCVCLRVYLVGSDAVRVRLCAWSAIPLSPSSSLSSSPSVS